MFSRIVLVAGVGSRQPTGVVDAFRYGNACRIWYAGTIAGGRRPGQWELAVTVGRLDSQKKALLHRVEQGVALTAMAYSNFGSIQMRSSA